MTLFGIPLEFIFFALLLTSIAFFHRYVLPLALAGMVAILLYKLSFTDFHFLEHVSHEWLILINLLGLLVGFALLASYFEHSGIPGLLPAILPSGWQGGMMLILCVSILSIFLDNIAAAVIGGTIARTVFHHRVHLAMIVALVAASNAGGAGSVIGDTTTTMMWISGVSAGQVLHAFLGSIPCIAVIAFFGARTQHRYQPIQKDTLPEERIRWNYLFASMLIVIGVITTNVLFDLPALGVWIAIIISLPFVKIDLKAIPAATKGALFLLSLVFTASMMPVDQLPFPSWESTLLLGFVSAIFDNIPLTKLAIAQGGYDWGFLAYAVGFGGSMVWFGSSAGVAISSIFPEAKSALNWLKAGWFVILAYLIGYFSLLILHGWQPVIVH